MKANSQEMRNLIDDHLSRKGKAKIRDANPADIGHFEQIAEEESLNIEFMDMSNGSVAVKFERK